MSETTKIEDDTTIFLETAPILVFVVSFVIFLFVLLGFRDPQLALITILVGGGIALSHTKVKHRKIKIVEVLD